MFPKRDIKRPNSFKPLEHSLFSLACVLFTDSFRCSNKPFTKELNGDFMAFNLLETVCMLCGTQWMFIDYVTLFNFM